MANLVYNSSEIVLIVHRAENLDVALAGAFQLLDARAEKKTDDWEIFPDCFGYYFGKEDINTQIGYWLDQKSDRRKMSEKARIIALDNTWKDRAKEIIKVYERCS